MFNDLKSLLLIPILFVSCVVQHSPKPTPSEEPMSIHIPIDISTQRPVLSLMIGDHGPYQFIFDTGSGTNILDTEIADKFGYETVGEDSLGVPGSPNKMVSRRVKVSDVRFENTSISQAAEMNVIDIRSMVKVDGIISPSFFSNYLITINYPESVLTLSLETLDVTDDDVFQYVNKDKIVNLDLSANGHSVEGHLDSGSPGGFALPFSMKDSLSFKEEPVQAGEIRTPTATFIRWNAKLDGEILLGGITYKDPDILLVEGFLYANIGFRVIRDLIISIDMDNKLIRMQRAEGSSNPIKGVDPLAEQNAYTGSYGGHERNILLEAGQMYLQRINGPKIKLEAIDEDLYKMAYSGPAMNELPNVRFERDANGKVNGLHFVFANGDTKFVKKDL